jgi:ankyrin repeat protein
MKVKSGHFSLLLLILLILSLPACTDSSKEARAKLDGMKVPYTGEAFVTRAAAGDAAAVQLFLAAAMDPNIRNRQGFTPLIAAAGKGRGEIVKLLLEHGADVNARETQYGGTALLHAVISGRTEIVQRLKGKRIKKKVKKAAAGSAPTDIVRLLLDKGADLEAKDSKEGRTALLWAVRHNRNDMVEALLDKGASQKAKDKRGYTALVTAALYANPDTLSLLLDRAGRPEQDAAEMPLLLYAAAAGRTDNIRLLLEKGADINARDDYGHTALMWAAKGGKKDVVKFLLEKGADAGLRDKEGKMALDVAKADDELMAMLFQAESNKPSPPQK